MNISLKNRFEDKFTPITESGCFKSNRIPEKPINGGG